MMKARYLILIASLILILQSDTYAQIRSARSSLSRTEIAQPEPQKLASPVATQNALPTSTMKPAENQDDRRIELTRKLEQRQMQLRRREQRALIHKRRDE